MNGSRAALLGTHSWPATLVEVGTIGAIGVAAWIVGTLTFRIAVERERRNGTLGLY
jgi:hypothetical protein